MSDKDYAKILDETVRTSYHVEDGNEIVASYQDVEPHLDYCHDMRRADAEGRGAFGARSEFHPSMSIPHNVALEIAQKLGIPFGQIFETENNRRICQELRKPEYKHFRTTIDKLIG
jgi:hypothetical protein